MSMKNKILCLIDTLSMGGGAERQMAGLAGFLHQKGYEVSLVTYHQHEENDRLKAMYGMESIILESGDGQWSKIMAVRKYVKDFQPDVVIAYKDGATMIACILKMFGMKAKLVVSERNTTTVLNRREKIKFMFYRYADVVVPNSYSQGEFIKKYYPKLYKKVNVITNFTDTHYFTPDALVTKRHDDFLHILVTARIAPQKNILAFMRVAQRLKKNSVPVKIDWYGGVYYGKEEYGKKVFAEYRALGIKDVFQFHDATNQILDAYRSCDMFCLPSYYEGYPNVICEAMSCGKPILCSRVCDNPLIVDEGKNARMFNPHDENDMYHTIKQAAKMSSEELEAMGKKSREIAESKFSSEVFVQKYISLIESL